MGLPALVAALVLGLVASASASVARSRSDSDPERVARSQTRTGSAADRHTPRRRPLGSQADAVASEPAALIARVKYGRTILVHRSPSRRSRAKRLAARTEFGSRRVLAVHESRGPWLGVASGARTDGKLAWVHGGSRTLRVTPAPVRLQADLSRRRVELYRGDELLRSVRVAVGRRATPTPTGRFGITDKLSGRRFGPYYGCCILALNGTQPRLPRGWSGGNRLAIHGASSPAGVGRPNSYGCLRAAERDLRVLMRRVPLGTPVEIRR